MDDPKNECLWCADVFINEGTHYHNRGFCSENCYSTYYKTIAKDIKIPNKFDKYKLCVICGSICNSHYPFCSTECGIEYYDKRGYFYQRVDLYLRCTGCREFYKIYLDTNDVKRKLAQVDQFCSLKCSRKYYRGEKHPSYIDGGSIKYCSKWNNDLKTRVRAFFGNKCFLCGEQPEKDGRAIGVHHVNYDKRACCNDKPALFVPLCAKCHGKTNYNRGKWEDYFETVLKDKYNYKCYYTKKEYTALISQEHVS